MTENDSTTRYFQPLIIQNGLQEEYPFAAHNLQTDDGLIHFVDEGQGPPLLFVHGNPTWSFAWRNLIKRFSGQFRCVAIDHLGCGLSEKPQEADYSIAAHMNRLQQLVQTLDLQDVTLIAHDWGGAIGTGVAGRLPDRFSKLVLMNTAAFRSKRIPLRIAACRIPLLGTWGVRGLNLFAGLAVTMAVNRVKLSRHVKRGYLAPYNSWQHRIVIDRFVKEIPLKPDHPSFATLVQIEEGLSRLQEKPILLPWGMKDWCFTPHFLDEFIERFPRATVKRFDHAGHYLFEDEAEGLGEAIEEFLRIDSL